MRVYLLIHDWAIDGDGGVDVVGVYADRKAAEAKLKEMIENNLKDTSMEYLDQRDIVETDYFDAWEDGYYVQEHEHIFIDTQEVQ